MKIRIPNAIQITAVNTSSDNNVIAPALINLPTPDETAEYATQAAYWTKQAAKGAAILYIGKKFVDAGFDVAVIAIAERLTK